MGAHGNRTKMGIDDILIVSALQRELSDLELNTNYDVIYTGVGKVNATYSLLKALQRKNVPIHTLVDCTKFIQRDIDASGLGFPRGTTPFEDEDTKIIDFSHVKNPIGKNLICGTGDNFVQDVSKELTDIDVFDMEAYSLSKTCWKSHINFVSYKYVTDNADESSPNDWNHNCGKGMKEFKRVLEYYDNL